MVEARKSLQYEACAFVHEDDRDEILRAGAALQKGNHFCSLHAFFYRLDGAKLVVTGSEALGEPE